MKFQDYWQTAGDDIPEGVSNFELIEEVARKVFNDATQLTIGAVVTKLWGISKKTTDKVDAARIKNIAGQIAAMDL